MTTKIFKLLVLTSLTVLVVSGILLVMTSTGMSAAIVIAAQSAPASKQDVLLRSFAAIEPIDAHVHIYKDYSSLNLFLKRYNLHVLDIAYIDDRYPFFKHLEPQVDDILRLVHSSHGEVSLCTTFNPYPFEEPEFSERAVRQLNENFAEGAVAVKIYKTVGMEIRKKNGQYLMPDDPVFEPIYKDIASQHRTLIEHLAEPTSCWLPPSPASPDYAYYKKYPNEYCYVHPEWPTKAAILTARDRMLEQNPNLRVVGAHLGSMEVDVDEIARRFDRYPNFAVDTAARVPYLMLQPRNKVRAFLIKYQDRIIYGTDFDPGDNEAVPKNIKESLNNLRSTYARDWRFFATDQVWEYRGKKIEGLDLPPSVLRKLYHDNAVRWYPGILRTP